MTLELQQAMNPGRICTWRSRKLRHSPVGIACCGYDNRVVHGEAFSPASAMQFSCGRTWLYAKTSKTYQNHIDMIQYVNICLWLSMPGLCLLCLCVSHRHIVAAMMWNCWSAFDRWSSSTCQLLSQAWDRTKCKFSRELAQWRPREKCSLAGDNAHAKQS